jgi:hypothetical protein
MASIALGGGGMVFSMWFRFLAWVWGIMKQGVELKNSAEILEKKIPKRRLYPDFP